MFFLLIIFYLRFSSLSIWGASKVRLVRLTRNDGDGVGEERTQIAITIAMQILRVSRRRRRESLMRGLCVNLHK